MDEQSANKALTMRFMGFMRRPDCPKRCTKMSKFSPLYILSYAILSCPVLSCPILSHHVLSYPIPSRLVPSHPVWKCLVLFCPVFFRPALFCPVLFCPALSCLFPSCSVPSRPAPFRPGPACLIPNSPALSHPILFPLCNIRAFKPSTSPSGLVIMSRPYY